jgi:hypothetical protein
VTAMSGAVRLLDGTVSRQKARQVGRRLASFVGWHSSELGDVCEDERRGKGGSGRLGRLREAVGDLRRRRTGGMAGAHLGRWQSSVWHPVWRLKSALGGSGSFSERSASPLPSQSFL